MNKMFFKRKRVRRSIIIIKDEGFLNFVLKLLKKLELLIAKRTKKTFRIKFLATYEDIENASWVTHPYKSSSHKAKPPLTINWVMSPPRGGGGHQNIYRFIKFLEDKGHKNRVYIYSNTDKATIGEIKEGMKNIYPDTEASMQWLDASEVMEEADIVFATGWETAYPVFNDKGHAQKFYFVQDFEPYFYPLGSEYILAENTYRFNFTGITAGKWLSNKLNSEYGMKCEPYDFGVDEKLYRHTNKGKRKEIFFYARPVTARRGFELGIMALDAFHKRHPEYTITLAGWDVSEYKIPFPYNNLKVLKPSQLSDLYNRCAAALVISLTNMSLLPLELISCGTIPVVTEGPNNRMVSSNKYIQYAFPSPDSLAAALSEVVEKPDLENYSLKASKSVESADWHAAGEKLEQVLIEKLNG